MILYMYIAPGQRQTTWGQNFDVNKYSLSLFRFVASLKNNLFEVWFFTVFSPVYSPRQGQTTHWGQKFYDNRKAFSLCPYVTSFKMISWNLILYTFLMIWYMYIALVQWQKPLGDKLLMSRESPYHFDYLLKLSNKSAWILILYTFF